MREGKVVLPALIAFLLLCQGVAALGLAHEPLLNKTLELAPGENYFFKLIIQNNENEDKVVNVTLESDIANLVGGGVIKIPAQTYDRFVYFNITVPEDAEPGSRYQIKYAVLPAGGRGEGQVPFAVRYLRNIYVRVSGEPSMAPAPQPQDIANVTREVQEIPFFQWDLITIVLVIVAVALLILIIRQLIQEKRPKTKKPAGGKDGSK